MTLETYDVNKENAEETITLSPSQAAMMRKPLKEDLNVKTPGLGIDRPDRFDVSFFQFGTAFFNFRLSLQDERSFSRTWVPPKPGKSKPSCHRGATESLMIKLSSRLKNSSLWSPS